MRVRSLPWLKRRSLILAFFGLLFCGVAFASLVFPLSNPSQVAPLQLGQVAPQDILAPRSLSFPSDLLTKIQREKAAAEVAPVYSPPDTSISRRQLEHLRSALAFISAVRSDSHASPDQKMADLNALEEIHLTHLTAINTLALSNTRWQAVEQEAIIVLEQVMRSTIQEDRLVIYQQTVPTLISLSLTEDQAAIVTELVSAFVVPNSLYDARQTDSARQQARLSVDPVLRSFKTGETIIQRGKVITDLDLEALAQFGLLSTQPDWQDSIGAAALVLLVMAFLGVYLRTNPLLIAKPDDLRSLGVGILLFLFFLLSARIIIPGHTVLPYVFPLAAFSLTITVLFRAEPALVSTLALAILITYRLPFALEITMFYVLGSFFGVLTLRKGKRITSFFSSGGVIALTSSVVILAYHLAEPTADWIGIATLVGASLVNGLASSILAVLFQFFLAQALGMTTALQLMELTRPDNPLLQRLLRTAPGTYQHSLQVANLVEQAAERIGADALLTRVGAMYHDIGKTVNPAFFIENQLPGSLNPHDDLDPVVSASLIIQHVPKGLELARKYRLPPRIRDFIAEHHGDMLARYQFIKAVKAAGDDEGKVDPQPFRYPGPRPRTQETALLMLADGCEARVRAEHPKDEDELRALIESVVDHRVASGQLDDTELTLHDLDAVVDSFTATLRGIYHPRIEYPKMDLIEAETLPEPEPRPSKDAASQKPSPPDSEPPTRPVRS